MKQFTFDDKDAFIAKLRELTAAGTPVHKLQVASPFPVHDALHLLKLPASPLKFFTFTGALTGFCTGFGLTIYTVLHWPIITSGKPVVSLPPFTIIAFELTILLGAISSMLGFLHLNRLPSIPDIIKPEETGNQFVIYVKD
jgi:hypothetical protein